MEIHSNNIPVPATLPYWMITIKGAINVPAKY